MAAKSILIGLGNPIMSDDGIGPAVASEVHKYLCCFDLDVTCSDGFDIVDRLLGHETAVIIDAMVTGKYPPGKVVRFGLEPCPDTLRSRDSHSVSLGEAIRFARFCNAPVPPRILTYGIEVRDPFSVGEEISKDLLGKLHAIAEEIARDILAEMAPDGLTEK
jgi:hydrogenase maturation protease